VRLEIELLPHYEYRRGWSSRGDLFESLDGLFGVAVFDPILLDHLSYLDHCHLPFIIALLLRWLILLIFVFIILSLILILSW
jgi:hypothetical protein